jgi:hypothetical protein
MCRNSTSIKRPLVLRHVPQLSGNGREDGNMDERDPRTARFP